MKVKIGNFEVPHKTTAVLAGIEAQFLIMMGTIGIVEHPQISLLRIFYGFFIMLPVAYYQMRASEKE